MDIEDRRSYAKEYQRQRRLDPEYRERARQYSKERYHRLRKDPEGLEHLRAGERRRYAARKEHPAFQAKEYVRNQRRRFQKYGITKDEYLRMAEAQQYKCAVCHEQHQLCIDHCHTTGRVRGLLCRSCNTALGHLREDVQIMRALISYTAKL